MSPGEVLASETREWLVRARGDLDACAALMAAELPREALFHTQQCAEKAMKALLTWHQIPFQKTHDLDELKQACLPLSGADAAHLTGIERLSEYAWRFRYPGAPYSPGREEAEEAHLMASRVLEAVAVQLKCQFGDGKNEGDHQ